MIPVREIEPENLYSQDDGQFLLGEGFSEKAARETICEACRSGQLASTQWRKRYWFTGRAFLGWVSRWSGVDVEPVKEILDPGGRIVYPAATDPEPARRPGRR